MKTHLEPGVLQGIYASLPRFQGTSLILARCALGALTMCMLAFSLTMPSEARATTTLAGEDVDELRHQELIGRRADVTVLRLNELGEPVARLDLHFGGALPESEARLFEILNQFEIGEDGSSSTSKTQRESQKWRNLVLSTTLPPDGPCDMSFFDPEASLAIEFRWMESPSALTCNASFAVGFSGSGSAGKNFNWYMSGDLIACSASPATGSGADPDAYISVWNGSSYVSYVASTAYGPDSVFAGNTGCQSMKWKFRVRMDQPGAFFASVVKIIAN